MNLVSGQSYGVFSSPSVALSSLSSGVCDRRVQVIVLSLKRNADTSAWCSFTEVSKQEDVEVFAVFGWFNTSVFWGYVTRDALSRIQVIQGDCFLLSRSFCEPKLALDQCVLDVHPSFNAYRESLAPDVEVSLSEVEQSVQQRFYMYRSDFSSPHLDAKMLYAATHKSVLLDNLSYFLVLSAISDLRFASTYPSLTTDQMNECWARVEKAIGQHRVNNASFSFIKSMMPPFCKSLKTTTVLHPFEREHWQMPFERCPPRLLATRKVVLRAGQVLLHRAQLRAFLAHLMMSRHKNNMKTVRTRHPDVSAPNLQPILAWIRKSFALLCDSSLAAPLNATRLSPSEIQLLAPKCMQALHNKAVGFNTPHLKYQERLLFSRFLFSFHWSMNDILNLWRPKMRRVYKGVGDRPEIVSSLRSGERSARQRRTQAKRLGTSCWDLCQNNMCPLKQGSIEDTKALCMQNLAERLPPSAALPLTPLQSPQHFVELISTHRQ